MRSMLSSDMHLQHGVPGIWYEADLEAPIPTSTEPLHVAGVTIPGLPLIVVGHKLFQALAVAHERLARCGIRPHGRIGEPGFYFGEFPADAGGVKDTPAGRALGRAREHKQIRDR